MLHAREDYNRIQDPEGLIPEDEPVFLVRAQDAVGPSVVEDWANRAESRGVDPEMVSKARKQANRMRQYQAMHGSKIADM